MGGWVVVYSEYSVLLWSKALVLDLDQAEQKCLNLIRSKPILDIVLKFSRFLIMKASLNSLNKNMAKLTALFVIQAILANLLNTNLLIEVFLV